MSSSHINKTEKLVILVAIAVAIISIIDIHYGLAHHSDFNATVFCAMNIMVVGINLYFIKIVSDDKSKTVSHDKIN